MDTASGKLYTKRSRRGFGKNPVPLQIFHLTSMRSYTKIELEEAKRAISSTINKCEKALFELKENSAQQTLLERRIKAFCVSVELIEREFVHSE